MRLETVVVTEREFPARVRVDLHRSIDRLFERCTIKHVCGIRLHDNMMFGVNLTELLAYSTNASAVPLGYEEVDVGEEKPIRCLRNGLWLLESAGVKVAVVLSQVFGFNEPPRVRFDVATENNRAGAAFAESFFSALEEAVRKAESYRGKVLSLETGGSYTGQSTGIKVHKLPAVARGDVILPRRRSPCSSATSCNSSDSGRRFPRWANRRKKVCSFTGRPATARRTPSATSSANCRATQRC